MAREEFSGSVVVQKTIGSVVKSVNYVNVTTAPQTVAFGVNLINYLQNQGSVEMTVEFRRGGVTIGSKRLAGGYGLNDLYLQIDELRVYTTSGSTTLDGVGVA